jgi:DNA-3-methyladenine glycosylase I
LKIKAAINNSRIFRGIVSEYGSFYAYLRTFCKDTVLYETGKTTNAISDALAKDLQSRGMKFVGSTTMYAYLQAVGLIYAHEQDCFLYRR